MCDISNNMVNFDRLYYICWNFNHRQAAYDGLRLFKGTCAAVRLYNAILVRLICASVQDLCMRNKGERKLNFIFLITHGHHLQRSERSSALLTIVFGLLHRCLVAFL